MKIQDKIDDVIALYTKEQSRGMCYFIDRGFGVSSDESYIFGQEISEYLRHIRKISESALPHSYMVGALNHFYLGEGLFCTLQECYEVCLNIYQDWENKPTCKEGLIKMLRSVQGGV